MMRTTRSLAAPLSRRPRSGTDGRTGWSRVSSDGSSRDHGALEVEGAGSYRLVAESRPLVALGGDFYEMSQRDGVALVTIGDVSGHGATASRLMLPAAERCRHLAASRPSPREMLEALNAYCCTVFPDHMFATLACVMLDPARGSIRVANAGHVVPLVRRASGAVSLLGAPSGPPLGMAPGYAYTEQEFELDERDILLLLTDGVVDALEHDLERMTGLSAALEAAAHDAEEIINHLLQCTAASPTGTADDLTILTMEHRRTSRRVTSLSSGRNRQLGAQTLHG